MDKYGNRRTTCQKTKIDKKYRCYNFEYGKITNESFQVADVEKNSKLILENLDKEFERKTGLQGNKAQTFYT